MLKKILSALFSMEIMGMGMLVFAFSIGFATFVEHKYGTIAARGLIYNAWWFEAILVYTMFTLTFNIFRFKMYGSGRWGGFVFHLAFIIIIIGAGLTRYLGDEGNMSIRENHASSSYITSDKYFKIKASQQGEVYETQEKSLVSVLKPKKLKKKFTVNGTSVKVVSKGVYTPNNHGEVLVVTLTVDGKTEDVAIPEGAGLEGPMTKKTFNGVDFELGYSRNRVEVPFQVFLDDFVLERYPGSNNPSSYKSLVTVSDDGMKSSFPYEIKMNHVLDHRGYRFFQSSYDGDEMGTVLSVNKDKPGTKVTYIGYFFLFLGIFMALFDKHSRFRMFLKMSAAKRSALIILFMMSVGITQAQSEKQNVQIDFEAFNKLWVQTGDGRIKPMFTFADEVMRKISKSRSFDGYNASEVVYGYFTNPQYWMRQEMIKTIEHPLIEKMGLQGKKAAFLDFFNIETGRYLLAEEVNRVLMIPPAQRKTPDNHLLTLDERVQICRMLISGDLPLMLPNPEKPDKEWISIAEYSVGLSEDSLRLVRGLFSPEATTFNRSVVFIHKQQTRLGGDAIPSDFRQAMEFLYQKLNILERLSLFYGLAGMALLFFAMLNIFTEAKIFGWLQRITRLTIIVGFAAHTLALVTRGVVSGYWPLSNGYESVVFVAWVSMLVGILFSRKNAVIFSLGAMIAAFSMLTSHMSFMNPQITQLVPVLKSYWLTIHVTMITASYGFFGFSFVLGLYNLVAMAITGKDKTSKLAKLIDQLHPVNAMAMEVGLYMITIGCFLGGIWANVSWGRYWSWDPKETWALVSILVYGFIAHMHHIPGFGSKHYFNAASVLAFSSILMTYFGVNFFLGGMHSYAGDGSVALSAEWYIATAMIIALIIVSGYRYNTRKA